MIITRLIIKTVRGWQADRNRRKLLRAAPKLSRLVSAYAEAHRRHRPRKALERALRAEMTTLLGR